jgi:hypothetical protein
MIQTKKIVGFVVELYKLDVYWEDDNGYAYKFDPETGQYGKVKATRYIVKPDCYKRTAYERFNSVRKLNKALGLRAGKFYRFHASLEGAIKGAYANDYSIVRNCPDEVLVIRQLHALGCEYTYYKKK